MSRVRGTSTATSASADNITVNEPVGTEVGDFVSVVVTGNTVTTLSDNNGSTPFTKDRQDTEATDGSTLAVFSRKKELGDPATYNFNSGATDRISAICIVVSGKNVRYDVVPSAATVDVESSAVSSFNCPSILTNKGPNNITHIAVCMMDTAASTFNGFPAGYTEGETQEGAGQKMALYYKDVSEAYNTGLANFTTSGSVRAISISFSIVSDLPAVAPFIQLPPKFSKPSLFIAGRKPTGQVALNYSNPFAKGIVECCLFQNAAVENLADNENIFNYPDNDGQISFTKGGMEHDTTSGQTNFQGVGLDATFKTVTLVFEHLGTGTATESYYYDGSFNIDYNGTEIRCRVRTSGSYSQEGFTVTREVGKTYVVTVVTLGETVIPIMIVNGLQRTDINSAGSGTQDAFGGACNLWKLSSSSEQTHVRAQFYVLHDYAMTLTEAIKFNQNVYQIFKPKGSIHIPVPAPNLTRFDVQSLKIKGQKPNPSAKFKGFGHNIIEYFPIMEKSGNRTYGKVEGTPLFADPLDSDTRIMPDGISTFGGIEARFNLNNNDGDTEGFLTDRLEGAASLRFCTRFKFRSFSSSDADRNGICFFYQVVSSGSPAILMIRVNDPTNTVEVSSSSGSDEAAEVVTSSLEVALNTWYHLDCRIDFVGDNITLLMNGEEWINSSVTFTNSYYTRLNSNAPAVEDAIGGQDVSARNSNASFEYILLQKNTFSPDDVWQDPYQFLTSGRPIHIPAPDFEIFSIHQKAKINWAKIPKSIAGYWLLKDGSDLTGRNPLSLVASAVYSGDGLVTGDNNDWAETRTDPVNLTGLTEFTVVMEMTLVSISSLDGYCGVSSGQIERHWIFQAISSANNSAGFTKDNIGGDVNATFANESMIEGSVRATYVFKWSNAGTTDLWRNDGFYEQLVDGTPGTFDPESGKTFYIGQLGNGGVIHSCHIYSKALPDALCQSLAFDPHQFLVSKKPFHIPYEPNEVLDGFWLTDPRWEKPALLTKLKKPAGRLVLDKDHRLADGLIKAFFFINGDMREYVNLDAPTANTTAFSHQGLKQTGTEYIAWPSTHFDTGIGSLVFDFTSNGNVPDDFCELVTTGPLEFRLARNSADTALSLRINNVHGAVSGLPDIWDQTQHKISAQWEAATNFRTVKVDDTLDSSADAFTSVAVATDFHLLNRPAGDRECEGDMTYCLVYNRILTESDADAVHDDPHQMLIPA